MIKKNIISLFFLIATFSLIFSCNGNEGVTDLNPVIESISAEMGIAGDVLTITGSDFGTNPSKIKVMFHRTEAMNIISIKKDKIELVVPSGLEEAIINITVQSGNTVSNPLPFYFLDTTVTPYMSSITPICFSGAEITITGVRFSPRIEDNIVKFGNVKATVTKATNMSLTVIAPDLGSETSSDVTVTRFNKVSNSKTITVDFDQNKVATYNWTTHSVRPGVTYKTGEFTLFGATNRRIHILDVTLNDKNTLGIGFSSTVKNTVNMCNDYDALAGINAGYFPMAGTVEKDPYIRIDGKTIQVGHTNVTPIFTSAVLVIHNNVASIRKITEGGRNQNKISAAIPVAEAENIIVCGPVMVFDGHIEEQDTSNSHITSNTARTGLGVSADGKRVIMVVVDYNQGVTGVKITELAKIMQALGSTYAMNFDGGGSSTMFVKGYGDNGRVSVNGNVQRQVKSVIYLK